MNNEMTPSKTNAISNPSDRIAALKQKATLAIETWQPEPGEILIGELIGSQKAAGAYGENIQILIKDETGHITAAWLTAWLKENLRAQEADKGDLVAITFLAKRCRQQEGHTMPTPSWSIN